MQHRVETIANSALYFNFQSINAGGDKWLKFLQNKKQDQRWSPNPNLLILSTTYSQVEFETIRLSRFICWPIKLPCWVIKSIWEETSCDRIHFLLCSHRPSKWRWSTPIIKNNHASVIWTEHGCSSHFFWKLFTYYLRMIIISLNLIERRN